VGFETAQLLADRLTKLGYRVFFDVDTMRSGDFSEQIYKVIDHCRDVIVIISPNCFARAVEQQRLHRESGVEGPCPLDPTDWVRLEVAHAFITNKNIVPMLLRGAECPEQKDLPDDIAKLPMQHRCEASHEHFDSVIQRVRENLKSKPYWLRWLKPIVAIMLLVFFAIAWRFFNPPTPLSFPANCSVV